jgi:hypothetical protein
VDLKAVCKQSGAGLVRSDDACVCQRPPLHGPAGLNASQSAQPLPRAPRTGAAGLAPEPLRPRQPRPRPRTWAPCKPASVPRRERSPDAAAQGCQRRRAPGGAGGDALVQTSGRTVRPRRQAALLRLALAPGAGAPVAWGAFGAVSVGPTQRRRRCVVLGLCSSRMR